MVGTAAAASREPLRTRPGERRQLLFLAFLFLVQVGLLNQGVFHTTASRASVTISAHPFFLALFCHFFVPGDRLTAAKVAGILLAFAGVVLIFAEAVSLADAGYLAGDLMILGSAVLLGLRQTVMKRMVRGFHPYKVLFWQSLLSLPMFAAASAWLEGVQSTTSLPRSSAPCSTRGSLSRGSVSSRGFSCCAGTAPVNSGCSPSRLRWRGWR